MTTFSKPISSIPLMNASSKPISSLPLWISLLLFGIPSALQVALAYLGLPLLHTMGVPLLAQFILFSLPLLGLFVAAFIAYRLEGRPWQWQALVERFWLQRMSPRQWLWSFGLTVFFIVSYIVMAQIPLATWFDQRFPLPAQVQLMLGDSKTFAGLPLRGQWWILGLYLLIFFFNIFGEELWWRGYIFPRQELTHGRWTWIVHGLLWDAYHVFFMVDMLLLLPGSLALSYVVQKQRNIWPAIIAHGVLNALSMIRLISGILG